MTVAIQLWEYQESWPREFDDLAFRLRRALGEHALAIDHIGSTAVPGLVAKPVIDAQVVVRSLAEQDSLVRLFRAVGFDLRSGEWNFRDHIPAGWTGDPAMWQKFVVAPKDAMSRPSNVHVRVAGSPNERYALLFRDFLRSHHEACRTWAAFKERLAASAATLPEYGQLKDPATDVLMTAAEQWAQLTAWRPRARPLRSECPAKP